VDEPVGRGRSRASAQCYRCAVAPASGWPNGGVLAVPALPHSDRSVSAVIHWWTIARRHRQSRFTGNGIPRPLFDFNVGGPALVVATDELPLSR